MRAAGKAFVGVFAVLFYAVIVLLGVMLLATVQLRSSSGAGANYDTWRRNYQANSALRDTLTSRLNKAQEKADNDAAQLNFNKTCLRLFDGNHLPNHRLIDTQTADDFAAARRAHTRPENLDGDVLCLVKGYTRLDTDAADFDSRLKADTGEIAGMKSLLSANDQQYSDLIKGHQDFFAFKDMEILAYYKPFVLAPYDLLVLVLVMLMGASGGVVRLLRDYGAPDHPNPGRADYFVIPLIGAVVAMCGYVLAKTGLLALSSTREETSLSPFMISFVGIISGLLAKEVIDTIAARGRRLLQGQEGGAGQSRAVQTAQALAAAAGGSVPVTGPQATPEHAG